MIKDLEFENSIQLFYIHLDTKENSLPLLDFIKLTQDTKSIYENINLALFKDNTQFDFLIFPPDYGSFKITIGMKTFAVASIAAAWGFVESDTGSAYLKGLTGHDASYWAEEVGKSHKEIAKSANDEIKKLNEKLLHSKIMSECTKGFLLSDKEKLRKIGLDQPQFRQAHIAKNHFYETCIQNPSIAGLGFSNEHKFPIKRNTFPTKIVPVPDREADEDKPEWVIETKTIKISSPVWVKDGRKWQAIYNHGKKQKNTSVTIEDDLFWNYVDKKILKPKIFDNMKVQWAYIKDNGKQKNTKILRVLSYNGTTISKKLSKKELIDLLDTISIIDPKQTELFED